MCGALPVVKRKHIPLRTCVSCGLKTAKRDLLRIVAHPEAGVVVDSSGRQNGRGAYVCSSCRQSPEKLNRGRLERSLRTKIDRNGWADLLEAVSAE